MGAAEESRPQEESKAAAGEALAAEAVARPAEEEPVALPEEEPVPKAASAAVVTNKEVRGSHGVQRNSES